MVYACVAVAPPPALAHVRPPVLPDCACRNNPFVGELLTLRFASSTILSAIVVALPEEVTSPVKFAFVVTVAALPVQLAELPVVFWFNVATLAAARVPVPILSALVVSVVALAAKP